MKYFNFHTHCYYCDGADSPETIVLAAIEAGMSDIGFTSHSPLPFENTFSLKIQDLPVYQYEIRELQEKYKDKINVYLSLEFDYIPGISDNFYKLRNELKLDYILGSIHLVKHKESGKLWFIDGAEINYTSGLSSVFHDDIKLAVDTYFDQLAEMIITQRPDVLGHFDKIKMHNKGRYFDEKDPWFVQHLMDIIELCVRHETIVEVNTRGIYKKRCDSLYPGIVSLKEMCKRNVPVTISTDAHNAKEVILYYREAAEILKETGYKSIMRFDGKKWIEEGL